MRSSADGSCDLSLLKKYIYSEGSIAKVIILIKTDNE